MKKNNDFNSLFENLMTPEVIEDNGFSNQVLNQLKKESSFLFITENLWTLFSITTVMIFFRVDLILMNSYLKLLQTVDLLSKVNGADFSISFNKSTILIIVTALTYLIVEKAPKLLRDL